mmetsp:Transcript_20478/g.50901  ORF Transcript_20478/g.50901 Transcript_20478/m.50901 type:complete len:259 (+) Transcript_20478:713-1489(+)
MDDNIDVIIASSKQVVCLDDLQSLVHHSSTVEGDFGTHVPVRMGRGLGLHGARVVLAHIEEFILGQISESSTRSSQDDSSQTPFGNSLQTLEDGTVFTVGGKHVDAVFFDKGVDDGSAANECFFVCKGNVLLQFDSLDGRLESSSTDNTGDNRVSGIDRRTRQNTLVTVHDSRHVGHTGGFEVRFEFCCGICGCHRNDLWGVLQDLFGHELRVGTSRKSVDDEIVRASIDNIKGLGTDRSRGSKKGESLLESSTFQRL